MRDRDGRLRQQLIETLGPLVCDRYVPARAEAARRAGEAADAVLAVVDPVLDAEHLEWVKAIIARYQAEEDAELERAQAGRIVYELKEKLAAVRCRGPV